MGRTLAVDWGERRLGLAVSDPTGLIAQGVGVVQVTSPVQGVDGVCKAAREWEVERVLVGLPLNMDGTEGDSARRARELGVAVTQRTGLPVVTWDERLTSVMAERMLREGRKPRGAAAGRKARARGEVDVRAAVLLLQSYLDSTPRPSGGSPEPA